jgi:integrase
VVSDSTYVLAMQKKKAQASFSAVSRKKQNLPPNKPKNIERRKREYLTPAEVKDLREAAKAYGRYGTRDHLMILIAYRHALRVSELCDLRWEQIDFKAGLWQNKPTQNVRTSRNYPIECNRGINLFIADNCRLLKHLLIFEFSRRVDLVACE